MAFRVGMPRPRQPDSIWVAQCRIHGSALKVKGKGEQVEHHGQPTCGARLSRMSNILQGQSIKGIETSSGLLQGSIMCPDNGGVGDRGADHGGVYPLRDMGTWSPIAACGGQQDV